MPIDPDTALLLRAFERYIATAIGGLAIYCGFRLFQAVDVSQDSSAEFSFKEQGKLILSHVGPGVFFALFGSAIVVASILKPLSLGPETSDPEYSVTYFNDLSATQEIAERRGLIYIVNGMAEDEPRPNIKLDFQRGVSRLKLSLMWGVWHEDWGDRSKFAGWALGSHQDAPPDGTDLAVEIFLAGQSQQELP